MMKTFLGLALAATAFVGHANAAPVYAQTIVAYDQNGTTVAADRSDPEAVKGAADGIFYSLGLGGYLVLDFGVGMVTTPGVVTEVTFRLEGYIERMQIFVSDTLDFSAPAVATVLNAAAATGATLSFATDGFRYVKLVDISPVRAGRDGFDVDSISFSPVPVPAAGLLLVGGLAGLGALRRRAKKTA